MLQHFPSFSLGFWQKADKDNDNDAKMASLRFSPFPSLLVSEPPPLNRHRRHLVRCSDDRRALFNRIAPVYDNVRTPHPFLTFLLFTLYYTHSLSKSIILLLLPLVIFVWKLNDLLSLGQHRIWKRMAVSWSG